MKIKILVIASAITFQSFSLTVYKVTPGTKGNEIKLRVANVSDISAANNVEIVLSKNSSSVTFNQETKTIEIIKAKAEAEALFTFDVNRNAPINKKDTIEFMITSPDGIMMTKSFIFNYTAPKEFRLEQNFPNPFNPTTTIQYQIPASPNPSKRGALVTLKVYDILGSEVETLVNEEQQTGFYEVKFDASNFASGMYIYRLVAGNFVSVKKMLMIK